MTVFDAKDIFNLYEELCLYRDKSLLHELEMAVFCEICNDTRQGRLLGRYFTKIAASMPNVHFKAKYIVELSDTFKFSVLDNNEHSCDEVAAFLTVDDVIHEIEITYGINAKEKTLEALMVNPLFFNVNSSDQGSMAYVSELNYAPFQSPFGKIAKFEVFIDAA
ncbi:hypothetical protein C9J27_02880 [Photobacterium kishitanii]|uniref:Uncharacterized protein n=1 Tax=Photobacterium kishitanii TaxID=318456 RepID=A0A2T3KMG1_9GAMM|nr:hypothetical protein C9J27_02880 [Photobacterium kishitanii]